MLMSDYQLWLNAKGASLTADGEGGQLTRDATKAVFTNTAARAVDDRQIAKLASMLGCTFEQITAVSNVEAGGSAYDNSGRPKMLFERHKFSKFTDGAFDISSYSNPDGGGYSEDSWEKLTQALCKDIDAAFKSASWGKFQVMGYYFPNMEYASPLQMAYSCVRAEFYSYYLFAGYIRMAALEDALRQVSTRADDCRAFAKGYNGPAYEDGNYHVKIADEMQRQEDDALPSELP